MTLKAYFIDAEFRTIKPILISETELLENLYDQIGCTIVQAMPTNLDVTVYVDEEGWVFPDRHKGTWVSDLGEDIRGHAVVLGPPDEEGNDTDVTMSIQEVAASYGMTVLA